MIAAGGGLEAGGPPAINTCGAVPMPEPVAVPPSIAAGGIPAVIHDYQREGHPNNVEVENEGWGGEREVEEGVSNVAGVIEGQDEGGDDGGDNKDDDGEGDDLPSTVAEEEESPPDMAVDQNIAAGDEGEGSLATAAGQPLDAGGKCLEAVCVSCGMLSAFLSGPCAS